MTKGQKAVIWVQQKLDIPKTYLIAPIKSPVITKGTLKSETKLIRNELTSGITLYEGRLVE